MKKVIALIACVTPFLFGPLACRSQVNPTGPVYTAPVAGNGAYTPLNPVGGSNPPTTALNYTDSPSGEVAYVVQGYLPASGSTPAQYGPWSNVAGPVTGGATGKVQLTWTCTPGTGTTCTSVQWVVSRAPATTALAPATPTLNTPTTSMLNNEKLTGAPQPTLASNIPAVHLTYQRM